MNFLNNYAIKREPMLSLIPPPMKAATQLKLKIALCVVKRAHYLPRAKILIKQRTIITRHLIKNHIAI